MATVTNPILETIARTRIDPDAHLPQGLISADSHVTEPPHCYFDYIDPAYRDRAPRVAEDDDGGDASLPTSMLQYWVRDRAKGPRLPLAEVVRGLSAVPAAAVGLDDRGLLKPGYKADINLIDMARIRLRPPRVARDLPAGGRRITQDAEGYVATIVSGTPIQRDGVPTAARPGRLVRSGSMREVA